MTYTDHWRFRSANGIVGQCDEVIELLIAKGERNKNSGVPLEDYELRAAYEFVNKCGMVLNRIFSDMPDRQQRLIEFVFSNETGFMEEVIEDGNKHFVRLCEKEDEALDAQFASDVAAERVTRGIAWLNSRSELGTWEPCIDRRTLKMHDPCNCVGGTIFGLDGDTRTGENGFKRLCGKLEEENLSPVDLGFQSDKIVSTKRLQEEWLRQVAD